MRPRMRTYRPEPPERLASARASATVTSGVDARRRPTRKFGPNERSTRMPAARARSPATIGTSGNTAAMIRGGHEKARRNLRDTWALRRSQPLVTLGLSGLPAPYLGPRRRSMSVVHEHLPGAEVVHRPSTEG